MEKIILKFSIAEEEISAKEYIVLKVFL